MAKLILSLDGTVLREVPLDKERLTIGRRPSNDLQIENLAVSGEHALIVTILNDSFLEDLGSTNGTLVNGVPIKKHILQHNDVIEIGKYKLKYLAEMMATGVQGAAPADFEKTMIIRPGAAARAAETGAGKGFGAAQIGVTATQPGPLNRPAGTATGQYSPAAAQTQSPHPAQTYVPPPTGIQVPPAPPQPAAAPRPPTQTNMAPVAPGSSAPGTGGERSADRCDPDPHRSQRRQGTRSGEEPHDARQTWRPGGCDHASASRLFHYARRRRELPHRQRQDARCAGTSAARSRCRRTGWREDGILPSGQLGRAPERGDVRRVPFRSLLVRSPRLRCASPCIRASAPGLLRTRGRMVRPDGRVAGGSRLRMSNCKGVSGAFSRDAGN
jgi:pSer/pThr/pTyr-binding forkhead associated (FHA) protein